MSEAAQTPQIRFDGDELHIAFAALFAAEGRVRRFSRRILSLPPVRSLRLEPAQGRAVVRHHAGAAGRQALLAQLADTIDGAAEGLDDVALPDWQAAEPVTLHCFGTLASCFEIAQPRAGRLQLRHDALRDPALCLRVEEAVREIPGVGQAISAAGKLSVSYADTVDLLALIRAAEAPLAAQRTTVLAALEPGPAKLGLANATLGLAAVGEFALPVVLPVCVGLLVASNLGTIRDAGRQLSQGKAGLPVAYTALLGCSIATGQIVAHALMEWSFRYWAGRRDAALADECRRVIADNLPIPAQARQVRSEQVDAQVPTASLKPGDRIRVDGPNAIPVDGKIVAGGALVAQTTVCGSRAPVRKSVGDAVWAGSRALAGSVEIEVQRTGTDTQAAQIAQGVIDTARTLTQDPLLRRKADAMADKAVPATLGIAGVGWMVGGLFTVGAVLHQDHASGPKLAVPLQTLRDMNLALRGGVVLRSASALQRLAESRFVVLDDHPAWTDAGVELESLHSRLAEAETNNLLRSIAGAGLYLGDGRSDALLDACAERGLVVRQPPLLALDAEKVAVRQAEHLIVLRNSGTDAAVTPLMVEIDGTEVASLRFRPRGFVAAADAVRRLRQRGIQVFHLSSRPEAETERLARRLGADLHSGDFSAEQKIRFLQGLKRRGVLATYVGSGKLNKALAQEAHVAVALGGLDRNADIAVLGDALDGFADVAESAQGYDGRIHAASRKALLPNVMCIVGGYAGLLNGITSGLIANLGVYEVYRQTVADLHESRRPAGVGRVRL